MLPDKQNSATVDIGAARARRLDIGTGGAAPTRPLDLFERVRSLSSRLQTSLEVDRLLLFFLEDACDLLPLHALSYRHSATDLDVQIGEAEGYEVLFTLAQQAESLGELRLFSHARLSELALVQVEELLACLLFPLRNALLYRRAVQASLKDSLTGAGNRVALEQSLVRETELAWRHGQLLSVVMLDMDHFKRLNDTYGHQAGDAALKATALLLKEQLRNIDMVFRFGGEEFALVLSNTGHEAAAVVAERIRTAIQNLCFLVGERTVHLSASLGYATYKPGETPDELLQRADQALYQAKHDGRNRVCAAPM